MSAARYPVDYGYVAGTAGPDGDPIDAMVMLDQPAFPHASVMCRAPGVLWIETKAGPEAKILALPSWDDSRRRWKSISAVPQELRREIGQFF